MVKLKVSKEDLPRGEELARRMFEFKTTEERCAFLISPEAGLLPLRLYEKSEEERYEFLLPCLKRAFEKVENFKKAEVRTCKTSQG